MLDDAVQVTRCANCKATYWVQDAPVLERVPYGSFNQYSRALGRYGDAPAILAELNPARLSEEKKCFMQALKAEEGWLVALRQGLDAPAHPYGPMNRGPLKVLALVE